MTDRPHSLFVDHDRCANTHGLVGDRPGCLACEEMFGPDYFRQEEKP